MGLPLPEAHSSLEGHFGGGADAADEAWGDVEHALLRAPLDVVLEPVPPEVPRTPARAEAGERIREAPRDADRRVRRIGVVALERLGDASGAVRIVERELVEHTGAQHGDILAVCARSGSDRGEIEQRADVHVLEAHRRGDEQPCAVRRREDERLCAGCAGDLARRVAEVEALDVFEPPLARELRRTFPLRERAGFLDLRAAQHALVAGGERLRHRRRRAQDVDDDPDRRRSSLARSERDVDEHATTLVPMPTCYRHPDRETGLSCSECGRPICTECMTVAPVGLRCPDHAGGSSRRRRLSGPRPIVQAQRKLGSTVAPVTKALIAINVAIYLITTVQGNGLNSPGGALFNKMLLFGPYVDHGGWWRLITAAFLHANLIHIGFNMLALWWFGAPVEQYLGRARFIGLYLVAGLAGSAGALLQTQGVTVGASGAIFGILGAMLILEWQATGRLGGNAMTLIVINLVFSFTFANISW